ncbi:TPA: hypothetical protein TVE90_000560 [Streptococcus equi subsp. zooepidemicus]|nr:hypothetical protein [Streptococcus equi subsp. zooepidemicus]
MKFPNKVISYNKSILAKLPVILNELQKGSQSPATLYKKLNKKFVSVAEFSSALDCLYALGAIELLDDGVIQYVS